MISEGVAGRPIEDDRDFLSLGERWIHREIDMAEMRQLYQTSGKNGADKNGIRSWHRELNRFQPSHRHRRMNSLPNRGMTRSNFNE